MPKKVQDVINAGTEIVVGKYSASGYDYTNDVLHIAKGATPEEVAHEIGHLVDNKLIDKAQRDILLKNTVSGMTVADVCKGVFTDASGIEYNVLYFKSSKFVSDYQGRIYVNKASDAFDANGDVIINKMQEFVAEIYREYWKNPDNLAQKYPQFFALIERAVK